MTEELLKELQKRLKLLVELVQLEKNKYLKKHLVGRIEELESIINLIERLEEKQQLLSIKSGLERTIHQLSSVKSEINIDLLKNAIWYSKEYVSLKDIDFEYLIEKYNDNKFIVDYLEMCARYNKIKKAAIELLMKV